MSGACCKIDYDQLLVYVESILNKKILCGELQPGLKSCSDEGAACTTILPQGTGVVTCAELADLVERLIEEGDIAIPGIKDFKLDGFVLELTDQADKVWRVDLEALFDTLIKSIRLQDGKLIFTKRDDTTWEVDLQPIIDEAKLVSATIDADGNLVLESGDGSKITVDLSQSAGRITQLLLDGDYVLHAIRGDGSEITVDLKRLKSVVVDPGSPILGDGTEEDPLTFDPSRLCLHLIENVEWTEAGLVFTFTDECDPLIVPIGTITTALKCKVAICVADGSGLTGDGTAENPLDFDPATLSNEKVTELIERLIDQLVEVLPDRLACKIRVCTRPGGGIGGDGTEENPLHIDADNLSGEDLDALGAKLACKVPVCTDETVDGNGTTADPLGVNIPGIISDRPGNTIIVGADGKLYSPSVNTDPTVSYPPGTEGNFVVPAGVNVIVVSFGGGGGGGASAGGSTANTDVYPGLNGAGGGGGGGSAATIQNLLIAVTPGQSIPYVVGQGGAGGAAVLDGQDGIAGGDGTSTTFNGIVAGGGSGGSGGTKGAPGGPGAGGGAGAGGLFTPGTQGGTFGAPGTTGTDGRFGGGGGAGASSAAGGGGGAGRGATLRDPQLIDGKGASGFGGGGGGGGTVYQDAAGVLAGQGGDGTDGFLYIWY